MVYEQAGHPRIAALDGGALLTAGPTGRSVLAPDAPIATPLTTSATGSLVTLEDGSVLAVGAQLARYVPTTQAWVTIPSTLPVQTSPSLARLADGSVLIVGGAASAEAWIYRPSLVGANTGSLSFVGDSAGDAVLTPPDPALIDRTDGALALAGGDDDDLRARIIVGGPRMAQGSIGAIVRVASGGIALLAQQTGPGRFLVGRMIPGQPARISARSAGTETVLCSGAAITEGDLTLPVTFSITGGNGSLSVGPTGAAAVKVTCGVPTSERGHWGLAAAGAGAHVVVGPITVARTR
jgi:hypothetical protein